MPHYGPNKYPNIFGCHIFTEWISEYIFMPEIAQIRIQIILEFKFIRIFLYSYSSLIEEIFEKGSPMLPLKKMLYLIFFNAQIISRFTFFLLN